MLQNAGLEEVQVWQFGQDFKDFISINMINHNLEQNDFVRDISTLFNNLGPMAQKFIDDNGFSDTMIIIAKKVR